MIDATEAWRAAVSELLDMLARIFDGTDPHDETWYAVSRKIGDASAAAEREKRALEVLRIEAQQYRDAHAHSQELRSWAERRAGNLRTMLESIVAVSDDPITVNTAERALAVDDAFIVEANKPFVRTP